MHVSKKAPPLSSGSSGTILSLILGTIILAACPPIIANDGGGTTSYTCQNGTPAEGNATSDTKEYCTSCHSTYKLIDNRCDTRTHYTCTNGSPASGNPSGNADQEKCETCVQGYVLTPSQLCTKGGQFYCANGTAPMGTTGTNEAVEKCASCKPGYKIENELCVLTQYTCANGEPFGGNPSVGNIDIEKCERCQETYKKVGDFCTRTQYTCANGTAATGNPSGNTDQEKCDSCSAAHKKVGDFCIERTQYAELCNPESGYIPVNYDSNGDSVYESTADTNFPRPFRELTLLEQLQCFKDAYIPEILPATRPTTTTAHRNSLPPGMYYDHSKYELIFEDTFTQPDTTSDDHNPYNYTKVLDPTKWSISLKQRHNKENELLAYPTSHAATDEQINWPVFIKNNQLYLGTGKIASNDVPNASLFDVNDPGNCYREVNGKYYMYDHKDLNSGVVRIEVPSCQCTAAAPHACMLFGNTAHIMANSTSPLVFQYGYMEVDFEQINTAGHRWRRGRPWALAQLELKPVLPNVNSWKQYFGAGNLPRFLTNLTGYEFDLEVFGVEFQLIEKFATVNTAHDTVSATLWMVLHYGNRGAAGTRHSRFYHTTSLPTAEDIQKPIQRKYGVEWTPQGYKVWFDDIPIGGFVPDKLDPYRFSYTGNCVVRTIAKSENRASIFAKEFIPCGPSHIPQFLLIISEAASVPRDQVDPYYIINHVRIYKPTNNYADVARLYH